MLFCNVNEEEIEFQKEFEKAGVIYKDIRLKNRGHICHDCGTFHTSMIITHAMKRIQMRIQRSVQVEGAFGVIKQEFGFIRLHRKGLRNIIIEFLLICPGYNLKKFHINRIRNLKQNSPVLLS